MARKQTIDAIVQLFQKLGGNLNDVLGTKTNINFLGKGKSPELMLDMNINEEALAILPQSKAIDEIKDSVGYAVSNKLNDIQANKLLSNMQKMDNLYNPPAEPKNVVDLATGTKGLDKAGLMSLRDDIDLPEGVDVAETILPTGAGLEALKNVKGSNLIINDIVDTIYLNAGVKPAAKPVARANAREFLNRVKDLEDPDFPAGTTLSSFMEADDFRFMTEGGGGGMGDPLLLVQKYFGPKVATAVTKLDSADDIQKFAERLVRVKDGRGRSITERGFDPQTVNPEDFEFADGGRVGFQEGGSIEARLEQLGGDVTSAEQMLQDINQRLESAESSLGEGGGNELIQASGTFNGKPLFPEGTTFPSGGQKLPEITKPDPMLFAYDPRGPFNMQDAYSAAQQTAKDQREQGFAQKLQLPGEMTFEGFSNYMNNPQQLSGIPAAGYASGSRSPLQTALGFVNGGRVGFMAGRFVGKALGMAMRAKNLEKGGTQMGYQALRKYGIEAGDISRLFRNVAMDKSLVGKEKTAYMKQLNLVLKNPDDFPDAIKDIQIRLGLDPIGFKGGGLAKILEL